MDGGIAHQQPDESSTSSLSGSLWDSDSDSDSVEASSALDSLFRLVNRAPTGDVSALRELLAVLPREVGDKAVGRAARLGLAAVVKVLLDAGARPVPDSRGFTPLVVAAGAGHAAVVRVLLAHNGATDAEQLLAALQRAVECKDDDGQPAANTSGHTEVVRLLLCASDAGALKEAMRQQVQQLQGGDVAAGAAVCPISALLVVAATHASVEIVKLLISHGADVDGRSAGSSEAPLHCATSQRARRSEAVVRVLLAAGADPHSTCVTKRQTALHYACKYGHIGAVDALLAAGAAADAADIKRRQPLHYAAWSKTAEAVDMLLAAGARISAACRRHLRTPLHYAARKVPPVSTPLDCKTDSGASQYNLTARLLLAAGADPNAKDLHYLTPFDVAVADGNVACLHALLGAGADVRLCKNKPLHSAASAGSADVVEALLSRCSLDPAGSDGSRTCFQLAAAYSPLGHHLWGTAYDRSADYVRVLRLLLAAHRGPQAQRLQLLQGALAVAAGQSHNLDSSAFGNCTIAAFLVQAGGCLLQLGRQARGRRASSPGDEDGPESSSLYLQDGEADSWSIFLALQQHSRDTAMWQPGVRGQLLGLGGCPLAPPPGLTWRETAALAAAHDTVPDDFAATPPSAGLLVLEDADSAAAISKGHDDDDDDDDDDGKPVWHSLMYRTLPVSERVMRQTPFGDDAAPAACALSASAGSRPAGEQLVTLLPVIALLASVSPPAGRERLAHVSSTTALGTLRACSKAVRAAIDAASSITLRVHERDVQAVLASGLLERVAHVQHLEVELCLQATDSNTSYNEGTLLQRATERLSRLLSALPPKPLASIRVTIAERGQELRELESSTSSPSLLPLLPLAACLACSDRCQQGLLSLSLFINGGGCLCDSSLQQLQACTSLQHLALYGCAPDCGVQLQLLAESRLAPQLRQLELRSAFVQPLKQSPLSPTPSSADLSRIGGAFPSLELLDVDGLYCHRDTLVAFVRQLSLMPRLRQAALREVDVPAAPAAEGGSGVQPPALLLLPPLEPWPTAAADGSTSSVSPFPQLSRLELHNAGPLMQQSQTLSSLLAAMPALRSLTLRQQGLLISNLAEALQAQPPLTAESLRAVASASRLEELRVFDRLAASPIHNNQPQMEIQLERLGATTSCITNDVLLHWAQHLPRLSALVLKVWISHTPSLRPALPLLQRLRSLTLEGFDLRGQPDDEQQQQPVVECLLTQAPALRHLQIDGRPRTLNVFAALRGPSLTDAVRRLPPDALARKTVVVRTHRRGKFF